MVPGHLAHGRGRQHGVVRRRSLAGLGGIGGCGRILRRSVGEDRVAVVVENRRGVLRIVGEARIVDLVERHGAGMGAQLGRLLRREAAALVEHGRRRQVARDHEEAVGDGAAVDPACRLGHGGIELEHRLRRLLLVPQRDRQDAAVLQGAHVARHGLARVGELLDDGEAAGARQAGRIGQAQIDDVVAVLGVAEKEAPLVVDDLDAAGC